MRHAANGEGDGTDVELSGEDCPAELLHNVFKGVPILANHRSIVEWKATVFVRLRMPEIVLELRQRLPSQGHLVDLNSQLLRLFSFLIARELFRLNCILELIRVV